MTDERVKRCVYCGGSDHPAECGYTQEEIDAEIRALWASLLAPFRWLFRRHRG